MEIDTEVLKEKLQDFYAKRCKEIDETVKNDRKAFAIFTGLELQQLDQEKLIHDVEQLYREFVSDK